MAVEHDAIPDAEIHEPKGAATAANGSAYIADGVGSGTWSYPSAHGGMFFVDIATPYVVTYPATYTKIAPVTSDTAHQQELSQDTAGKLTYTGTGNRHFNIDMNVSMDQASGANRDIRFAIYKNGVIISHSENIRTTSTGNKGSVAVNADVVLATNDYLEVFVKNDGASGDVNVYTIYLFVVGAPVE